MSRFKQFSVFTTIIQIMNIKLPSITHLQFLILKNISPANGAYAFQLIKILGFDGAKFYQLMGRLIESNMVKHEYKMIDGSRNSHYHITSKGIIATRECYNFYVESIK